MIQDFFAQLTTFVDGLEPWQQILALVPAGGIPFIESYLGSFLGILVGVHPAIAIPAAVLGNLIVTFTLITLAGRTRTAVAAGLRERRDPDAEVKEPGRAQKAIARNLQRFGVPGACLLGPLAIASQITAPTLVALGATQRNVYIWMGISIVVWGVLFGVLGGVFSVALA